MPLTLLKKASSFWLVNIVSSLSLCAVYAFIFVSALLLANKYQNREINYFQFLTKRLIKVGLPYLIWSSFYYFLFVYKGYYTFDIAVYLKRLVLGEHLYHLYFIVIIIQFYALFPLLIKCVERLNFKLLLIVLLVINILFSSANIPYKDRIFVNYLVIFYLGLQAGRDVDNFNRFVEKYRASIVLSFIAVASLFAYIRYSVYFNHSDVDALLYAISFMSLGVVGTLFYYLISSRIAASGRWASDLLLQISLGSFYIYLSHPLMLLLVDKFFSGSLTIGALENSIIAFLSVVAIVFPLSILWQRFRSTKQLANR